MKEIINLTPHEINVIKDGEVILTLPSQGVARAESKSVEVDTINDIPVTEVSFGSPIDLPSPRENTVFVVSRITIESAKANGRTIEDLLTTDRLVRNDEGKVVGCESFSRM